MAVALEPYVPDPVKCFFCGYIWPTWRLEVHGAGYVLCSGCIEELKAALKSVPEVADHDTWLPVGD